MMRDSFEEFVHEHFSHKEERKINKQIDWDEWLKKPGLPPVTLDFTSAVYLAAQEIADAYINGKGKVSPQKKDDYFGWFVALKQIFLQEFVDRIDEVTIDLAHLLASDLKLDDEINPEIINMWLQICVRSGLHTSPYKVEDDFLVSNGRMKFLNPVYQAINEKSHNDAVRIFKEHESFYHPIAADGLRTMLGIKMKPHLEHESESSFLSRDNIAY